MDDPSYNPQFKPTDLRGILRYVPQWRDHIFVIAVDGSVVDDDNFQNLLLDIAVLRSLKIDIIVVHGIGRQLKRLASHEQVTLSDAHGSGPTDGPSLQLAIKASSEVAHRISAGLTQNALRYAFCNAIRGTEVGVIKGEDQQLTGKVAKIDGELIRNFLKAEIIPVFSPIIFDRYGNPLRVNSDHLASELAMTLRASKLIYIAPLPGLTLDGEFVVNIPVEEVRAILEKAPERIDSRVCSKARYCVTTIDGGTPRAHIIDGRVNDGLVTEIFNKVGIGTMIHGNEYQKIRRARRKDIGAIHGIIQRASRTDALRQRTRAAVERDIGNYFVYEIDDSLMGCIALIEYPDEKIAELASVFVQPFYQGKGVGKTMAKFACVEALRLGFSKVFALTTQSAGFFGEALGFAEGTPEDLPETRRAELKKSGRNSRVLIKTL